MLVGCSGKKAEKPAAVAATDRPQPGFVRLLNLSPGSAQMFDRKRPMASPVTTNTASAFTTFPSGNRTLEVKGISVDLNVKLELEPGASKMVVLGSSGNTYSTINDPRAPIAGHNVTLLYLDADGAAQTSGPLVTLRSSGTEVVLSEKDQAISVPVGNWKVSAAGLGKSQPLSVVPNTIYDLVLVRTKTGRYFEVGLSHVVFEKPQIGSASKRN